MGHVVVGVVEVDASIFSLLYLNNKSAYDPPCINKYCLNSFLRSLFWSLIAITYSRNTYPFNGTCCSWCGVGRCVIIVSLLLEPALSPTNLCMIFRVSTSTIRILCVEHLSVHSLLLFI